MIVPLVLSPNLFNFQNLTDEQLNNKFLQLKLIFDQNIDRSVYIFDCLDFLLSNIKENFNAIKEDDVKLFIKHILVKKIAQRKKKLEINEGKKDDLEQICNIFIDLVQKGKDIYGLYANVLDCSSLNCTDCIRKYDPNGKCINIDTYGDTELAKKINKRSYIIGNDFDVERFKTELIFPIIKYSKLIKIYDKQISNLDFRTNDIPENYKRNILYWMNYFYSINNLIEIKIYTSYKDKSNKILLESKLQELESLVKEQNPDINFEIRIIEEENHERYYSTDLVFFSCDRGIDLIDSNGRLRDDIHINIIDSDESQKIAQKLNWY